MKASNRQTGFTLVELLVVIGIIALLIGILLPVLGKVREKAKDVQCMSNFRQWGMGIQMYANMNKNYLPDDGGDGDKAASAVGRWDDMALWFNAIPPNVEGKSYFEMLSFADAATGEGLPKAEMDSLFVCPSATGAIRASADSATAVVNDYFNIYGIAPPASSTWPGGHAVLARSLTYMCYVWNSKLNADQNGNDLPRMRLTDIRQFTDTVLMVEKRMRPQEVSLNNTQTLARTKCDRKRFAGRHRGGGYLLFADGHVDWAHNDEVNTQGPVDYNQPGKFIWAPNGSAN